MAILLIPKSQFSWGKVRDDFGSGQTPLRVVLSQFAGADYLSALCTHIRVRVRESFQI